MAGASCKVRRGSFSRLIGQPTAQNTLLRALANERVHHAYRFEGPDGVGKETAAFLLAQALLCTESTQDPCGECSTCRRVETLADEPPEVSTHPDVILVGRALYPSGLLGGASEATGISVEQIRRIVLARMGYPPHEGRNLVIIVRNADELTISAANALLKTLEEPGKGVHFILLTSRPAKLLDTILSRTLAVRFGPLPENAMSELLGREQLSTDVIPYAQGSMARARILASEEAREKRDLFVNGLSDALEAGTVAAALKFADSRPEGRADLLEQLRNAATSFATTARESEEAEIWANRYIEVMRGMREIEANGSPALVLESMVTRMIRA